MFKWEFEAVEVNEGEITGVQKIGGQLVGDFRYQVVIKDHPHGGKDLRLVDQYGFPEFTATVTNYHGLPKPAENQVIIKGYSENAGLEELLVKAGVVYGLTEVDLGVYLATVSPEFTKTLVEGFR